MRYAIEKKFDGEMHVIILTILAGNWFALDPSTSYDKSQQAGRIFSIL